MTDLCDSRCRRWCGTQWMREMTLQSLLLACWKLHQLVMWSRFFDVPDFIRGPKSVAPVDDLTSSSSLNPPATTISLSTGACEHNSSDKKCAISALLSANDRKFDQFLFEVHHDLQYTVWLSVLLYCTAFWSYPWLFRSCTCRPQHRFCDIQSLVPDCLHLSIGHISKDHSSISLSKVILQGFVRHIGIVCYVMHKCLFYLIFCGIIIMYYSTKY